MSPTGFFVAVAVIAGIALSLMITPVILVAVVVAVAMLLLNKPLGGLTHRG